MARKKSIDSRPSLPSYTRRAILAVVLLAIAAFLALAAVGVAGVAGSDAYRALAYLLGIGYVVVPVLFLILGVVALREEGAGLTPLKIAASVLFLVAGLGFADIVSGEGGLVGRGIAEPMRRFFSVYAGGVILGALLLIALLILVEGRISLKPLRAALFPFRALRALFSRRSDDAAEREKAILALSEKNAEEAAMAAEAASKKSATEETGADREDVADKDMPARMQGAGVPPLAKRSASEALRALLGAYSAPPLSLLERDRGKPGVGDIKANANIIKRTLANFGIVVELDEISIGPSVTRYAIKPAEGVRLSKIVSLQNNLELALAASPVRIEAPIPGKSLVGIEVPNSSKVTVGLGTMLGAPEFRESERPLMVALGRDIAGASHFADVAKMPHLLIAGATGSGKSVAIHALITSLLFRNSPQNLRLIMIDPKRVELTLYNQIPHLLDPVITDPKKAIAALRWAGKEMSRRYDILEQNRVRDISSYHQNVWRPALERLKKRGGEEGDGAPEAMPYIVIIIDELADIMQTFPRELEAAIVRLAQMSRAVGIHLVLSTQRPSVNVITGLIKANIPARLALQVASQIDSRTILDAIGAEKLLGSGDMLYLSSDMGKPVRLQSAFIGEDEVKRVAEYVAKHNDAELPLGIGVQGGNDSEMGGGFAGGLDGGDEVDDDMYDAAREAVIEAGKASTSYIQRKLRVGYARAARLMDILEERGIIGPQDGAKPREILQTRASGNAPEEEIEHA